MLKTTPDGKMDSLPSPGMTNKKGGTSQPAFYFGPLDVSL